MVTVQPATPADVEAISVVLRASVHWLGVQEGWDVRQVVEMAADHSSRETIARLMGLQTWWTAWLDGQLVGVVSVFRNEIARLFVHPDSFRRRVGSALFREAEHHVARSGFQEIRTRCFPASRPFYEAMGMSVVEKEPCQATGFTGREILVMSRRLTCDGGLRSSRGTPCP